MAKRDIFSELMEGVDVYKRQIKVRVRHQHNIDGRQIAHSQPGTCLLYTSRCV